MGTDTDVAPSQGRGLKHRHGGIGDAARNRRPFTGAWIETIGTDDAHLTDAVAPSQGRGLKLPEERLRLLDRRRPFTGAWIETF